MPSSGSSRESSEDNDLRNLWTSYHFYILYLYKMNITATNFSDKITVKNFILQEAEKMKASCVSEMKGWVYHRTWGYTPDAQPNLAWYNNGGTSQDGAYVEIALQSDIREKGWRKLENSEVIRISNSEIRLPAVIEYCKKAGMPYVMEVK